MNKIVSLHDISNGERIIVGIDVARSFVMDIDHASRTIEAVKIRQTTIAFEEQHGRIGWPMPQEYNCGFGWHVDYDLRVMLLFNEIISPNLKCSVCQLPAPHSHPNVGNEFFICTGCRVLGELA